jgi:signal transduction histidine kinase
MPVRLPSTSISRRLTWMSLLVSGAALLLASVGFLIYDQFAFRESLRRDLSAQAQIIGANSVTALTFNDPQAAENTLAALKNFPEVLSAGIITKDGKVFARFARDPNEQFVMPMDSGESEKVAFHSGDVVLVRAIEFQGQKIGAVFIRSSLDELSQRLWRYALIAGIVLLISLIGALLVSSVFRRSLAQPIINLAETARAVTEKKDYSLRAPPVSGQSEIDLLVTAFNEMLAQIQSRDKALRSAQDELEQRVEDRTRQLVMANQELEAFSYSVSHDLRSPLQTIHGFVHILLTDYSERLDEQGREFLQQIRASSRRMAELIEDLLNLSHVSTTAMHQEKVDLSTLAQSIADELCRRAPSRRVEFIIGRCPAASGDSRLLKIAMENLLGNAFKYTSGHEHARIEFGCEKRPTGLVYFVRDDGAGFDANQAGRLFKPFQRLHSVAEFPGTGIGLATVQRIVQRHGGDIWAESQVNHGATFYFTLAPQPRASSPSPSLVAGSATLRADS